MKPSLNPTSGLQQVSVILGKSKKTRFAFQDFAPRVLVMYVIALLAFLFYISKVPERYFPGMSLFIMIL